MLPAVTSTGAIGGQIGGGLGSLLGTSLAAGEATLIGSVLTPVVTGLASALGAASGAILGVALPLVGAFLGTLVGTWLGNFIGTMTTVTPPANCRLREASSGFTDSAWGSDDWTYGEPVASTRDAIHTTINQLISAVGGRVANDDTIQIQIYNNHYRNTSPQTGNTVSTISSTIAYDADGNPYNPVTDQVSLAFSPGLLDTPKAQQYMDFSVIEALKRVDFAGGNLYIKRALDKTHATTLEQLVGEIKIAEDYGYYLGNKAIIDELIAQNPNSAFAAGWIITLLRAQEMGITEISSSDFVGGIASFLPAFDVGRFGASLADVSFHVSGTTLVIDIVPPGQEVRHVDINNYATMAHLLLVTGTIVTGTAADELWFAGAASIAHSLTLRRAWIGTATTC